MLAQIFEDLPLYQKHKDFSQMHSQIKLIAELMKTIHAEYVHEKCPQCFINGKQVVTQLCNSYDSLFELQEKLYPQHDYTIRPDDSVHNFKTMTFVRSEKNSQLIEQIVSGHESLRVNTTSAYEIQHILEQQFNAAVGLLEEEKYSEYLETVPYQFICQSLAYADRGQLQTLEQCVLKQPERLKQRGKQFVVAVTNRIEEFLTDDAVVAGKGQK